MAIQQVNVIFNTDNNQLQVGGMALKDEMSRKAIVNLLISAATIILNAKIPVIIPATSLPGENGKPLSH